MPTPWASSNVMAPESDLGGIFQPEPEATVPSDCENHGPLTIFANEPAGH